MRRSEMIQGVKMLKFRSVFDRWEAKELSQLEAAELLGVGERTFRRWCARFEEKGESGLADGRLGRRASNRISDEKAAEVESLYRSRYQGFTAKHFHEQLVRHHSFTWGYTWTKTFLQSRGLLKKASKRGAHRRKRPRRPMVGMMLHQDASRHEWIEGQPACDLVVTMDDATNDIYSAFLMPEEGTDSTFRGLLETFKVHGLPCSLYTDRGSHYFTTPKAGGPVDRSMQTQVGRALEQLSVEHIAAYSPQARGRSERMFRTLQDRLQKEMQLAEIKTVEDANIWLRDVYIPQHNKQFAIKSEQSGSAFTPIPDIDLREVLCHQEERQVGNDNTVSFHRLRLQIPPSPVRAHYVRATVKVRHYIDGTYAIFHGPRCIGRYDATGASIQEKEKPSQQAA
jgi:transposase